ncbi:Polysaccharide deacetylase [Indibacter alkaliphilus LW1]|uniref:Polysaccharide deacetylase n=1 Tax=Indibacter alkaliphilus (strain CCUG 57479 / KCTC 22604 / LW1) TaxID=1189612 RepID=S2E3U5_INDAL|nr:polysaccharide deacetylase family protein [Indibacter alkaliphilus]EOZ96888.1 Polysaccharide deacetylase [Indibacter alkaliphilus LW1]
MLWNKSRSENKIYLTFDDGPVPGVTDFVLDELAKRKMKATFFMVGDNIRKHPALAKKVADAGHGIGNHTFHHANGYFTALEKYLSEIKACQQIIFEVLERKTTLFRPPYGKLTKKQFKAIHSNYQIVMWDVLSGDYDGDQPAAKCLHKTKKYSRNGSIVLFHDQLKTEKVLYKVLPPYLDFIKESGFQTAVL